MARLKQKSLCTRVALKQMGFNSRRPKCNKQHFQAVGRLCRFLLQVLRHLYICQCWCKGNKTPVTVNLFMFVLYYHYYVVKCHRRRRVDADPLLRRQRDQLLPLHQRHRRRSPANKDLLLSLHSNISSLKTSLARSVLCVYRVRLDYIVY